jgi:hypothetical protein
MMSFSPYALSPIRNTAPLRCLEDDQRFDPPVSFSSKPNHSHAPKGREFGVLKEEAALCIGVAAGLAELPGDYTTA